MVRLSKRSFQILALSSLAGFFPLKIMAQGNLIDAPLPHSSGQSVSPSFEGWYSNSDGGFSLVFGYFNRNYEENISLPIGPNNKFEPGPADRGQPTYFHPRRHTGVFAVRVPTNFGNQELTWRITTGNESIAIPGHLKPEWEITALEEITSGNTPPALRFSESGNAGQGPLGVFSPTITTNAGEETKISLWSKDDGIKKSRAVGQRPRTGVVISKFRGPGDVVIDDDTPQLVSDKANIKVTFSLSGDYILRVLAWDDSGGQGAVMAGGFFCCWTNGFINVRVDE